MLTSQTTPPLLLRTCRSAGGGWGLGAGSASGFQWDRNAPARDTRSTMHCFSGGVAFRLMHRCVVQYSVFPVSPSRRARQHRTLRDTSTGRETQSAPREAMSAGGGGPPTRPVPVSEPLSRRQSPLSRYDDGTGHRRRRALPDFLPSLRTALPFLLFSPSRRLHLFERSSNGTNRGSSRFGNRSSSSSSSSSGETSTFSPGFRGFDQQRALSEIPSVALHRFLYVFFSKSVHRQRRRIPHPPTPSTRGSVRRRRS